MNILVIEDDKRVADLVKRALEESEDFDLTVHVEHDGLKGMNEALTNAYNLVISDIMLPTISGVEICKHIKANRPNLPVILLTALGTTDDKVEGFDAGADDYLVKPFEVRELQVRVRAVMSRYSDSKKPSGMLEFADIQIDTDKKEVTRQGLQIILTPKEFKLLCYLVKNPNRVLSRSEIAEKVWDTNFDTGTNFIDVYINYLRKKIDKPFEEKLIKTKSGMGFILTKDEN